MPRCDLNVTGSEMRKLAFFSLAAVLALAQGIIYDNYIPINCVFIFQLPLQVGRQCYLKVERVAVADVTLS